MRSFVLQFQKLLSLLPFAAALFLMNPISSHAGIKVLGSEIGVSTIDQVQKLATTPGSVRNGGMNKWNKGPTLEIQGSNYDIQGLQSVYYVFDQELKLVALVMTMQKHRFDEVFSVLAAKYKTVKKVQPFVGDNYAKFTAPDSVIEIDAPHLGFEMEVRYMTNAYAKAWADGVQAQRQQKQNNDKSNF